MQPYQTALPKKEKLNSIRPRYSQVWKTATMNVQKTTLRTSKRADKNRFLWLLLLTAHLSNSSAFNGRQFHQALPKIKNANVYFRIPSHEKIKKESQVSFVERQTISFPTTVSSLSTSSSPSTASSSNEINESETPPENESISSADKIIFAGSTIFAFSSLLGLLAMSSTGSWRYFLAGGICAAVSHSIPTPVDVVKTRKQVDVELTDIGLFKAARKIAKKEGKRALWAGLGPTAWGYLLEGAIKFGVYEVMKPFIKVLLARLAAATTFTIFTSQLLAFTICGIMSGLAASIILCPMEALRIRMVADSDFARNGWLQGGHKILAREGVSGLMKGLNPMILKQVPYTVTKNVSFDIITRFFYSFFRSQSMALSATAKFTIPFVSAAIASILSSITSQPGDMLLSLINAQEGNQKPMDVYREILRSERGVKGLFVGFKTRLLHVGIIVTLQLLIYDYVKRLIGIPATGSV